MKKVQKKANKFLLFAAIFLSIIISAILLVNNIPISAEEEIGMLKDQFMAQNINIENCEYIADKAVLCVSLLSESDKNSISANDITALRKSRNIIRYDLRKLSIVSETAVYNEVLKNSNGKTLIDSNIDLTALPEFDECSKLFKNIGIENTDLNIQASLSAVTSAKLKTEYSYDSSIGNTLILSLKYNEEDYSFINKEIADIMSAIDEYNKSNYSIQQVKLNVEDNNDKAFYMEADLVYRDFLWWQIPEMEDSWTMY